MYLFFLDKREHKKVKGVNKNAVATISHNEYKDILLNNKCVRESEDHRIGTFFPKYIFENI